MTKMSTENTRGDKKSAILNAAVSELTSEGIEGFRIESVLEKSEASFSSLYHHFKSREGLIAAGFVASFSAPILNDLEAFATGLGAVKTKSDLRDHFRVFISALFSQTGISGRAGQAEAIGFGIRNDQVAQELTQLQKGITEKIVSSLQPLQQAGVIAPEADLTAAAWYSQQIGFGLVVTDFNQQDMDIKNQIDLICITFYAALGI